MSSEWELDDGIKSIKSAWRREHTARANLEKMLEQAEAENAKLRELVRIAVKYCDSGTCDGCPIMGEDESCPYSDMARGLGVEVDG